MSFKVGQRVRFVHASVPEGVPLIGHQATITDIDSFVFEDGSVRECEIEYDNGEFGTVDFWQLEPIQDDGRKVISWKRLKDLWQPNHESAPA